MSQTVAKRRQTVARDLTLRHEIWKNRSSYMLIAPYFILFFLFTVLPVLMSI